MKERRKHFLINQSLQLRYMAVLTLSLVVITALILFTLYVGIWTSVAESFSDASLRQDMMTAARINQYEEARYPMPRPWIEMSFSNQIKKLSERQREVFKTILDESNKKLAVKLAVLFFFIAWGSIFLSHKIAGPLFRFYSTLAKLREGQWRTRIHLRRFDEARPVAEEFNRALEQYDKMFSRIKGLLKRHRGDAQALETEISRVISSIQTSSEE